MVRSRSAALGDPVGAARAACPSLHLDSVPWCELPRTSPLRGVWAVGSSGPLGRRLSPTLLGRASKNTSGRFSPMEVGCPSCLVWLVTALALMKVFFPHLVSTPWLSKLFVMNCYRHSTFQHPPRHPGTFPPPLSPFSQLPLEPVPHSRPTTIIYFCSAC